MQQFYCIIVLSEGDQLEKGGIKKTKKTAGCGENLKAAEDGWS